MSIYLDVIWFLNFSFDLLLLLLTAIVLKRKVYKIRLCLAAIVGSSIVVIMFTPFSYLVIHPIGKMIVSMLMVWIAFGFKRFRSFFQSLLVFYFVTFMVGGAMIGTHYFLQAEMTLLNGVMMTNSTGLGDPISWLFVVIGFPIAWFFSRSRLEGIETKKIHFDQLVSVSIKVDDTHFIVRGLIDSGNQLYDPLTRSPVMIIDTLKIEKYLPEQLFKQAIQKDVMSSLTNDNGKGHSWEHRIRIIPYRVVGQNHQFLLGFKPDEVVIETKNERIKVNKTIIGLNSTTLSTDDEYECIVHPKMLQGTSIQHVS